MRLPLESPQQNRLLASLPHRDYRRLATYLEVVPLTFRQVLHESGTSFRHVYFPYRGVVSLVSMVGGGKGAEVGLIGNEGVVGASAALGIVVSPLRAVVQGSGVAARISSRRLRSEMNSRGSWYRELFRFSQELVSQAAQTAACNRFHSAEQRLARWLLMTRDRVGSDQLHFTHQFLSVMLGVRRTGVTAAAANLRKRGLISYSRGNLTVLDPAGLRKAACACYLLVAKGAGA